MKNPPYATLKRKLDKVFSEWVRKSQNIPHCVSCGAVKSWQELQCGHFVSRVRLATRWEPLNAAPQCSRCNVLLRGNPLGYAKWLQSRYGHQIFDQLDALSRTTVKFSRADLSDLIAHYNLKLRGLAA